jgi:uncharacterized membrane protein
MKKLLTFLQISLILISASLLVNLIIESIFELLSFNYNLKHSIAFSIVSLILVSVIIKFTKQNVKKE